MVLLLAAAVRTLIAANTYVISTDAERFLPIADLIRGGNFATALSDDFHPLYPALMAGLSLLTGLDLEKCGVIISIVLGSLTIVPVYFITRELFSPLAGILAALVLAFNSFSAEKSANIMSEGATIFLMLCGAWALLWGVRRANLTYVAAAGALSGLAYLTRPEGLGIVLAGCVYLIICRKTSLTNRARIGGIALALAACVVFAGPYAVYLGVKNPGGFDIVLTQKKSVLQLLGLRPKPTVPQEAGSDSKAERKKLEKALYMKDAEPRNPVQQVADILLEFTRTFGPLGVAALIGVIVLFATRGRTWGNAWLLLLVGLYGAVNVLLSVNIYSAQGASKRHILLVVTFCIPWAGYGMERFVLWSRTLLSHRMPLTRATLAPLVFLALAFAVIWIFMLGPRREGQLTVRYAGEVIRAQGVQSPLIMTGESRIPYYAGGKLVSMPDNVKATPEMFLSYLKLRNVKFVVVSEDYWSSFKFLDPGQYDQNNLELLKERADEAAVLKQYGVKTKLRNHDRYIIYKVKY
jgi:hypothetical protein